MPVAHRDTQWIAAAPVPSPKLAEVFHLMLERPVSRHQIRSHQTRLVVLRILVKRSTAARNDAAAPA